eukprot:m.209593 g.209593  ORF g.209593 m.209593 type:complete len:429 (+) comp39727_c0_seq55:1965-3251(+)
MMNSGGSPVAETTVRFFARQTVSLILTTVSIPTVANDVYSSFVSVVESDGFKVSTYLMAGSDEKMPRKFAVNYWAIDSSHLPSGAVTGSVKIKEFPALTQCQIVKFDFGYVFKGRPLLFTTMRLSSSSILADYCFFTTSSRIITSTGASFNVCSDKSKHCDSYFLDWLAVDASVSLGHNVVHGSHTVVGGTQQRILRTSIPLEKPFPFFAPCIIAQITSGTGSYVVNAMQSTWNTSSIDVTIANVDISPWNETLTVDYLLFTRREVEHPVGSNQPVQVEVSLGKYVSEIRQKFSKNHFQLFRLYGSDQPGESSSDSQFIEHEFVVGPLHKGRELVTRYKTGLKTSGIWFTDDNGLEMQKRIYNQTQTERIAGNYYPMIASAYIEDVSDDQRLTFLAGRSHGCSSTEDGMMEIMLHRFCCLKSSRGINQ